MPDTDLPRARVRASLLGLLPVLLIAVVVRAEFGAILPSYAYSYDISAHEEFARSIGTGANPYAGKRFYLAWPPFWGFFVFALARVAEVTGAEFVPLLRWTLVAIDLCVILVLAALVSRLAPDANVRRVVLFGIALNPIVVLLTVQHGNFDSIVVTWIMLGLLALVAWARSGESLDWLLACTFFGLGVFTKTVPLALAPLLIPGARKEDWRGRALGAGLLLGPAAVGLGSFFILDPAPIIDRVIFYRSQNGRFGVSGILRGLDLAQAANVAERALALLLLALLALGCIRAWSWVRPQPRQIVLLAALIMLAIPTLGPGFAVQYVYWFLPLMVATWPGGSGVWKRALLVAWGVATVTYVALYGFAWDLGQSIFFLWDSPISTRLGRAFRLDEVKAWVSLPMFVSWLALLVLGVREMRERPGEAGVAE